MAPENAVLAINLENEGAYRAHLAIYD